ncbi:tRNA-modifying protein YgfZ [hydrothermal vent metagenome]|uniref:tRNA-modifying protein YgfZ n=1 Tax=hydrothermal vent metagenome TaxID=652676 RepID=A0A3B1CY67_9ZZZZ
MRLYKLDKSVLSFKNNAENFLNGLTSNEMDQPKNAFLNVHGKIVATVDQIKKGDDEYLLLIEKNFEKDLLTHLDRYTKLSSVKIKKLDKHVYLNLNQTPGAGFGQGFLVEDDVLGTCVSEEEYMLFRLQNNMPVQGVDYNHEFLLNVSDTKYVSFTKGCFLGQEPVSKVHNRSQPTWKLIVKFEDECSEEEKSKLTSVVMDPDSGRKMGFVFVKT